MLNLTKFMKFVIVFAKTCLMSIIRSHPSVRCQQPRCNSLGVKDLVCTLLEIIKKNSLNLDYTSGKEILVQVELPSPYR